MPERPSFQLCGVYDGSYPATRWLKKFEHETHDCHDAPFCLQSLDMLLNDDAADWAECNIEWQRLLTTPSQASLDKAKELLCTQFPAFMGKFPELRRELAGLQQNGLSNAEYYHRALDILRQAAGHDRVQGNLALPPIEHVLLSAVISAYVRGLPHGLRPVVAGHVDSSHVPLAQLHDWVDLESSTRQDRLHSEVVPRQLLPLGCPEFFPLPMSN